MYILCSKDEFQSLMYNCAKASKVKHNMVSCKHCVLKDVCTPSIPGIMPGIRLANACVIVSPNEDTLVAIDEIPDDDIV